MAPVLMSPGFMIPAFVISVLALLAFAVYRLRHTGPWDGPRAAEGGERATRTGIDTVNEGLLDHELLSADPISAWLSRYLTPTPR